MSGTRRMAGLAVMAALCLTLGNGPRSQAQEAGQEGGGQKQPYTMPEYNAYKAAQETQAPAQQVRALDDFVARYPSSALLVYVYPLYYQAYTKLKDYPKVIEYVDKLVALGDKVDVGVKYQALYARAFAYNALKSSDPAQAKAAIAAADEGLKTLASLKKPENMTEEKFDAEKKPVEIYFNGTAAQAAKVVKDWQAAIKYYKRLLDLNPDDAVTKYQLGQVYLGLQPPQTMDAFWYFARAVTSKGATQEQSTQVKAYLKKLIQNYQQAACDSLTQAELDELLQLASSATERPTTYSLPSAQDLSNARQNMTIATVVTAIKAGGDQAKLTWLAACGLEFPEVPGKLIDVIPGATDADPIDLKIAFVTSAEEFEAATTADMDVQIVGQPEAARVEKGNPIHFTATLKSYDPAPAFMVHWEKGKVKAEDIPAEKVAPKKATPRRSPRKPGRAPHTR